VPTVGGGLAGGGGGGTVGLLRWKEGEEGDDGDGGLQVPACVALLVEATSAKLERGYV
jgi:hypothetical protein